MEKTWKPTTAGILTIIAGCLGIGAGALLTLLAIPLGVGGAVAGFLGQTEILGGLLGGLAGFLGVIGAGIIGVGIVALIGGIYALRRRVWGFALAGAILATIASTPLGVLAIIFVSMGKKEFVRAPK
ncbi:hypothetical protein ACFLTJ_03845 [Chloroflexota bacterium]